MQPTDPDNTIIVYAGIRLLEKAVANLYFGCFSIITGFLFLILSFETLAKVLTNALFEGVLHPLTYCYCVVESITSN